MCFIEFVDLYGAKSWYNCCWGAIQNKLVLLWYYYLPLVCVCSGRVRVCSVQRGQLPSRSPSSDQSDRWGRRRCQQPWALPSQDPAWENVESSKKSFLTCVNYEIILICCVAGRVGSWDSSVVEWPTCDWKVLGSSREWQENYFFQDQISVLTLISVSIPTPCCCGNT